MDKIPNLAKYDGVIFDWDDTLAPSIDGVVMAAVEYLGAFNRRPNPNIGNEILQAACDRRDVPVYMAVVMGLNEIYRLDTIRANDMSIDEQLAFFMSLVHDKYRKVEYSDHAPEILTGLKRADVGLALNTSNTDEIMNIVAHENQNIIDAAPIDEIFGENIITSELMERKGLKRKREPDSYLYGAKQLGIEPKNILVVEDSLSGVRAGKAAGMDVVVIHSKHSDPERDEIEKLADYSIKSYRALDEQIKSL